MSVRSAIIVAGGKGERMNAAVPKQFLPLDAVPVIIRTINQFVGFDPSINVVVVLPEEYLETWHQIKMQFIPHLNVIVVAGGKTRFQSVKAGLEVLKGEGYVAIHDAVRPFVSQRVIADSFESAERYGSGVAAVPLSDSIREVDAEGSRGLERTRYRLVQTPQTFSLPLIKEAFQLQELPSFTDDAVVFEHAGHRVCLVDGMHENIKLTTPTDLLIAENYIRQKKGNV